MSERIDGIRPARRFICLIRSPICPAISPPEGYSFPTNLDRDPPIGGLAPQSQQALMRQALAENWDDETFGKAVAAQADVS